MADTLSYTLFVMQSELNSKDVYVAQTAEDPAMVVERYNAHPNPKALPKPLGRMRPLLLNDDLLGPKSVFSSQNDAIKARKELSQDLLQKGYNLCSKRPFYFGRKKSVKDKQTGKFKQVLDPSLLKVNDTRGEALRHHRKDAFSYGRKKSGEWNDDVAEKLQTNINNNIEKRSK